MAFVSPAAVNKKYLGFKNCLRKSPNQPQNGGSENPKIFFRRKRSSCSFCILFFKNKFWNFFYKSQEHCVKAPFCGTFMFRKIGKSTSSICKSLKIFRWDAIEQKYLRSKYFYQKSLSRAKNKAPKNPKFKNICFMFLYKKKV